MIISLLDIDFTLADFRSAQGGRGAEGFLKWPKENIEEKAKEFLFGKELIGQ